MTSGGLIADIIRTGAITIVSAKFAKAVGQKDIGDIIKASGIMICGVDFLLFIKPFCEGVKSTIDSISDMFGSIGDGVDKVKNFFSFSW